MNLWIIAATTVCVGEAFLISFLWAKLERRRRAERLPQSTASVRDLTERTEAERAAHEFGGRLLQAQEAERARLARELHDDITQRLARLAIDAARAESNRNGERSEHMRSLRDGLMRLSEDVHSLAYKLHPAVLEDLGLPDALKAECERFTRQENIPVEVKLERIPAPLPRDAALCLFRIAQESLRNVSRHARAKSAKISLRLLDGGLQLAVTDTGKGFDPRQPRQRPSLGLASMRERVRLAGGELDIESEPGQGTTVLAWVPLHEESAPSISTQCAEPLRQTQRVEDQDENEEEDEARLSPQLHGGVS